VQKVSVLDKLSWIYSNGLMCSAEAGYKALFLSVDVPVLGKRLNEYRNEFRIPEDMEYPNILSSGADVSDRTNYGQFSGSPSGT
jgi:isopentenyl diphosphate isomerase/L-lactate dehydrogenase-like FMN-dependent dehydrogenase